MEAKEPTCFTCGLPLGDPPRLNHLPSGVVCPTCRDRLLEVLPPLLPGGYGEGVGSEQAGDTADAPEPEPAEHRPARGPRPT